MEQQGGIRTARGVGVVLTFLFCAFTAHSYVNRIADLEAVEADRRRIEKSMKRPSGQVPASAIESERLQADLKSARRVIGRIGLPWDVLFREIDRSVDMQVTLLSVEPDVERGQLRITAEAKDFSAMLAYRDRVASAPVFRDAHLLSHQLQQQDPQKPVRFVLATGWDVAPSFAE